MRSVESDQVKAKYRFARCSNHMDGKDRSLEPFEMTIMYHPNAAAYGIHLE
jgi:hypothetical protein